ncbi:hypothetical protein ACE02Y_07270 [Shewanella xiamenensis]|uniref:Uncharacterized protein n=1 Tax=Shewanella xiamenensis TaxID=332186 RepID=A0AAE4TGD9_9GAMM|nr:MULTISPECIES: hypothetical protein [Shewanella]MDH1625621.1 hypothetical protein [Shewanella xiamenensis]MDV5245658.1 hypothetical protein [Shewanella xiamenensis]MDV5391121.1 hypothetical protein [Shewanella xiamenensis]
MFSNSIWALVTKNKAKADFAGTPLAISVISLSVNDDGLTRTD